MAGTLELVDREFNQLAIEIDQISESVNIADKEKILDEIIINSTTLKQFLFNRFEKLVNDGIITAELAGQDNIIIDEIKSFGINNLEQLDKLIPKELYKNVEQVFTTAKPESYLGLLRDILIVNDPKKYFQDCWHERWHHIGIQSKDLFEKFNIDFQKIVDDNNLILF